MLVVSSEEWSKVGDKERHNLGIVVEDDGEFWYVSVKHGKFFCWGGKVKLKWL